MCDAIMSNAKNKRNAKDNYLLCAMATAASKDFILISSSSDLVVLVKLQKEQNSCCTNSIVSFQFNLIMAHNTCKFN